MADTKPHLIAHVTSDGNGQLTVVCSRCGEVAVTRSGATANDVLIRHMWDEHGDEVKAELLQREGRIPQRWARP